SEQISAVAERSKELDNCAERYTAMQSLLTALQNHDPEQVRWLERSPQSYVFYLTPLDISEPFSEYRDNSQAAWVMTSATLTVNGKFEHFSSQLGMQEANSLILDSPFDYPRHAVLYAPDNMPNPNHEGFNDRLLEAAIPVIEASGGGAFLLCTSLRAVDYLSAKLVQRLPYTVLAQGQESRTRLLERFADDGNAVLVATSSFWEGVDVRGDALRLVIIDRLPFTPPDDPLLQSRERAIIEDGGNAFMQLQLPQAVIGLKQGVGRLIRSETDRGVVMICDPRLRSKPYGRIFLDSLPPMTRTAKLEVVQRFFQLAAPATTTSVSAAKEQVAS
ncbi:MAG: ATP-dependent DNA helicase, partial [Salinisphaeraceae bacterium]|nr:ATP-dependent DNA helicase [Salinisphaeraceae bacterium]